MVSDVNDQPRESSHSVESDQSAVVHLDAETLTPIGVSTPCPSTTVATLGFKGLNGVRVPCGNLAGHDGPHIFHVEWTDPQPYLHPDDGHTLDCTALVTGGWRCSPECPNAPPRRPAARLCDRCRDESKGLGSSAPCVCGPGVPCDWCSPVDLTTSPGEAGS